MHSLTAALAPGRGQTRLPTTAAASGKCQGEGNRGDTKNHQRKHRTSPGNAIYGSCVALHHGNSTSQALYRYGLVLQSLPRPMQYQPASPRENQGAQTFFLPRTPMGITGTRVILYLCCVSGSDTAQCRRLAGFHHPPPSQSFLWHVQTRSHLQATERKKSALSAGQHSSGGSWELLSSAAGLGQHPLLLAQVLCLGSPEATRDFCHLWFYWFLIALIKHKDPTTPAVM